MTSPAATVPVDLTRDVGELVRLATGSDDEMEVARRGLDWLARIAPYDLATVFALDGDRLVVRLARGPLADERVLRHEISLYDFPSVRESLETRRARIFTEADHARGDGDPFDDVVGFAPGHSCMVVPLHAGREAMGILTLDRYVCAPYPPEVVTLVEVYAQVLAVAIQKARQTGALARLHAQQRALARGLLDDRVADPARILEQSSVPVVQEVARRARAVARTDTPVLVLGETGTGKEQLARLLHSWSERGERPFVAVNCAAIAPSLLESELFGHVKGAFTGAIKDRPGRFQVANSGTLFLDEIGDLSADLQVKLLRVLQDGRVEPVGSDRPLKVDVRVIAATHVDLESAIRRGRFREDLFYRLSVFPLTLPPLRERAADLELVVDTVLADLARRTGRRGCRVTPEALEKLASHLWSGNLRELANVLERAMILAEGPRLGADVMDLPQVSTLGDARTPGPALRPAHADAPTPVAPVRLGTLFDVEREHIRRVLAATGGRIYGSGGAAAVLGLKPSTLQSRMKKLGVERLG